MATNTETLTKSEERAIERLQKAFSLVPKRLRVYAVGKEIFVCKVGIHTDEIQTLVGNVAENGDCEVMGALALHDDDIDCGGDLDSDTMAEIHRLCEKDD